MANSLNFAGASKLNQQSGMPQMGAALAGWCKNITLGLISQGVSLDGDSTSIVTNYDFYGTIQPLSVRQLTTKPEGQRSWKWLQIHALNGTLNLRTQDLIIYDNKQYKVMGIFDYSLNNYIEYHVVTDYVELP